MTTFAPATAFKNRHFQSIVASIKLRRPLVRRQAAAMLNVSREMIVDAGNGIRLQGFYSPQPDRAGSKGLAILIHGWEGSSNSIYLLSSSGHLFDRGFDVFRLNMRDHGDSHHLNPGLFHSCLIDEVTEAVKQVQARLAPEKKTFLTGFSLGGNFALRVALRAPERGFHLNQVVAVCPVLHPPATLTAIETGWFLYHKYFIRKWKRSLLKKQALFPDLYDFNDPKIFKSLTDITRYLVERYTSFPDMTTYLNGYSITGDVLTSLTVPVHVISSADDPVIPSRDLSALAKPECLTLTLTPQGGHCGFITGPSLKSWVNERVAALFEDRTHDNL